MADPFFRSLAEKMVDRNPPSPEAFYAPGEESDADEGGTSSNAPARKGLNPFLKYGPMFAHLADGISTDRVMKAGGQEADPLLKPIAGNTPALLGATAIGGLGMGLLADLLAKKGHPGWAKAASALNIVSPLAATGINIANERKLAGANR